jgi:hypothetical protein
MLHDPAGLIEAGRLSEKIHQEGVLPANDNDDEMMSLLIPSALDGSFYALLVQARQNCLQSGFRTI